MEATDLPEPPLLVYGEGPLRPNLWWEAGGTHLSPLWTREEPISMGTLLQVRHWVVGIEGEGRGTKTPGSCTPGYAYLQVHRSQHRCDLYPMEVRCARMAGPV